MVVDNATVLDLMTLAVLDLSEKIFVVTEAVTPTVLATADFLRVLEEQGFAPERLRLIANRHAASDGNLPPGTIAQRVGRPVDYVVAHDRAAAANRGVPVIRGRPKSNFPDVVSKIAEDIARPVLMRSASSLTAV